VLTFGVLLGVDRPLPELLDWASRFDQAGVDSLWVADHLINPADPNSYWLDGWTVLTAIAHRTARCRIGPLVSNFVLHPPMRLARLSGTVDALSGGRLDLGLGMGSAPACRAAASVFDTGPELAHRFERGVQTLVTLFEGRALALATVPQVGDRPPIGSTRLAMPFARDSRPPILVGGQGRRVVDVAAKYADRWNVFAPPSLQSVDDLAGWLAPATARFNDRCAAHGRTGAVARSVLFDTVPALGTQPAGRAELTDLVASVAELGFDECIVTALPLRGSDRSIETLLDFVAEDLSSLQLEPTRRPRPPESL
jgi:alkanesulfonate monooxygenase SsuD/methylene tetrahydromethanopterin reductase-like flavin-dependent oxidoreductase (luciferase family)